MATDLYVDTVRGVFVSGRASSSIVDLPPLVRGTVQPLRVFLLNPRAGFPVANPPYDFIPVAGQTIQIAVGILGAASYLTSQFVWTPSTDPASPYFEASLSFNTPAITEALGSGKKISATMQIDRVIGGIPTPVLLQDVTIKNAIIVPGTEVSPPGLTPLYAETAAGIFLTRRIVGHLVLVNDTDDTKQTDVFTADDGTFHTDPLAP